jgi:peptidoglycan/xylan/chitin deacetylase (PgdA/CDA1 family)
LTIPGWGRLTPSHGFMLMLAGRVLRRRHVPPGTAEPDEERLKAMALGRERLRKLTGQDFGYDLKRWHEHLLGTDAGGYRHPYGWGVVRPAIEQVLDDEDRLRLVEMLGRQPRRLSSEGLAVLVVDALVEAGFFQKEEFSRAVDVAREVIEVRKALGDYWGMGGSWPARSSSTPC